MGHSRNAFFLTVIFEKRGRIADLRGGRRKVRPPFLREDTDAAIRRPEVAMHVFKTNTRATTDNRLVDVNHRLARIVEPKRHIQLDPPVADVEVDPLRVLEQKEAFSPMRAIEIALQLRRVSKKIWIWDVIKSELVDVDGAAFVSGTSEKPDTKFADRIESDPIHMNIHNST